MTRLYQNRRKEFAKHRKCVKFVKPIETFNIWSLAAEAAACKYPMMRGIVSSRWQAQPMMLWDAAHNTKCFVRINKCRAGGKVHAVAALSKPSEGTLHSIIIPPPLDPRGGWIRSVGQVQRGDGFFGGLRRFPRGMGPAPLVNCTKLICFMILCNPV